MGTFGIGTNNQQPNSGVVTGEQIEIAVQSWSTCSGKTTPLMFKVKDEDAEIHTIRQIQVLSQEKKNYAGIPSVEYDCLITLLGKQFPAMLIHFLTEEKWVLKYK